MGCYLKGLSVDELKTILDEMGEPSFRAKQLFKWLHQDQVGSYDDMTNLPKSLREKLSTEYPLSFPEIIDKQISSDGTRKYLLKLDDSQLVETVAIPDERSDRLTVCFSTQVGCPMNCSFCATGTEGFKRNLTADEILDQIYIVQKDLGVRVSNLVAMGQGEPFLNYKALLKALRIINNPDGINIGSRHITISTCGIIDGIDNLSQEPEQFTLAISLHSAIQNIRDELMPNCKTNDLDSLKDSLIRYQDNTNRRISFEYLLIDEINDSKADLDALMNYSKDLMCHINLIPLNESEDSKYKRTDISKIKEWKNILNDNGIETSIRNSKGSDISGACGQLKNSRS